MVRLRASRPLSCFYCGRRSAVRFDGTTRQFQCNYCEATNYLDENGEIEDVPVATEREPPSVQYAAPRPSSPSESIFCSTCLKNQHLYAASLAQYLPDDPSHPDYAELERKSYRYRRSLEERYPQVCDACSDKVGNAIQKAGYTAKTDHLRRMMERTRGRKPVTRSSGLDWVNSVGRALWWGGLSLEGLWHVKEVSEIVTQKDEGMTDPDSMLAQATPWITKAASTLPPAKLLINISIACCVASLWWNPQFVKVSRGFTKHLIGFGQWYSFQALILFLRISFRWLIDNAKEQPQSAQLSAHIVNAILMVITCAMAHRTIKVDTTPLFGTHSGTVTPRQQSSPNRVREETTGFSDALTKALDSSTSPKPISPPLRAPQRSPPLQHAPLRTRPLGITNRTSQMTMSEPAPPQQAAQVSYGDEMDWTPTQPQQSMHRAFRESPTNPMNKRRPFNQAPTNPEAGAFWYKVPPAPINPAQRLRNPPNQPSLRSQPTEIDDRPFGRFGHPRTERTETQRSESEVTFKDPRFFAPNSTKDDLGDLANELSQRFTLHGDARDDGHISSGYVQKEMESTMLAAKAARQQSSRVELIALIGLLIIWLLTLAVPVGYLVEIQLGLLAIASLIALAAAGRNQLPTSPGFGLVDSALSTSELAAVFWIGCDTWLGNGEVGIYGVGALVTMLLHRVWHIFT